MKAGQRRIPAREIVKKRASGSCEKCGTKFNRNKNKSNASIHHRLPRRMNGYDTAENLLHLCTTCHCDIHQAEESAAESGWIAWSVPELTPVRIRGRWAYLLPDGTYEFLREAEGKEVIEYLMPFALDARANSDPFLRESAA